MTDWIGRKLGRVQIETLVARGGMAEVYLGTHTTLQRQVAVKILRNHFEDDPRPRERFELEARAVARLRHPNIVQVFDFDTIDGQPYIVMELIKGPSLSKFLSVLHARESRMELPLVGRLLTGVANALQYAHESGVIHRDVKPGNILLTSRSLQIVPGGTMPRDFEPVLTDFGLVRFLDSSRQTTIGQTAGTPAYMSPEQAMGLTTDGRTDIYSLGIVLYEMLSGKVPFDGETTMSVLLKHLNEAPAPIPGLALPLQGVLDRALAKTADDRFENPREFAAAFNSALDESSDASTMATIARVPEAAKEKDFLPAAPRRYLRMGILGGALIVLLGVSLWFGMNSLTVGPATATPTQPSDTPESFAPIPLGPTGVLQLHNGTALLDQATLLAQAMPAPPTGSQYEVWLTNGPERFSLGNLSVDAEGKGSLIFDEPKGENLLAMYSGVEVTIEKGDDSGRVAYSYKLPEAGLDYLRRLMVSSPMTPDRVPLIQGLVGNAILIDQNAREMQSGYASGDTESVSTDAESLMNLLVGEQSQDYRDWNGDGQISDPGDGYGLLLNGNQLGYIRAVFSHADYAANSPGASRHMIVNGENVKACTQNLARWAPELRDHLRTILNAGSISEMGQAVERSAVISDQMLNGVDLGDNNGKDFVSEGCGVLATREQTYRMADMPLLPVNLLETPTAATETGTPSPTVTPTSAIELIASPTMAPRPTLTQSPPNPPTNPPPQPTKKPKPTQKPKPTKKK